MTRYTIATRLLTLMVGAASAPSFAQSSVDADTDITVTARRREEPIEEVPFALAAISARDLESQRIDDTLSLFRQVPGLSLTTFDDGRFAFFQLRGVGPLSQAISPDDGSVVTYVDGVPQPVYASEFAYLDLERIEVLKGPQGTLFGRNAQGGAINVVTRQPGATPSLSARIERGNNDLLAQSAGSAPLGNGLGIGIAARASRFGGFVRNSAPGGGDLGDRNSVGGRVTLVYAPVESEARFRLTVNGDRARTSPFFYVLRPVADPPTVQVAAENASRRTLFGVSLTADVPVGALVLSSITAINGYDYRFLADDTDGLIYGPLFGQPASAFLPPTSFSDWTERERRFYQEVRLGSASDATTAWTVGGVYFRSDFDVFLRNRSAFSPFLNGDRDNEQLIDSYAVFGEVTTPITSRLTGTIGGRFTRDDKRFTGRFTGVGFPGTPTRFNEVGNRSFDLYNARAALRYALSDSVSAYATVALGEKSGGFPRFTLNAALGNASPSYAKSTTISYEVGTKGRFANGRGGFDLSGYLHDTRKEQLFILDFVTFQFLPANLDTRSYGLEANVRYRVDDRLSIAGGLQVSEAKIREPGPSGAQRGNQVPNVARFSTNASLDWRGDGSLAPLITVTHQYVGSRSADVANSFALPAYHNVDARAGVAIGSLELYAFGRNLTDARPQLNGVLYGPGVEAASVGRGRTFGIGILGKL